MSTEFARSEVFASPAARAEAGHESAARLTAAVEASTIRAVERRLGQHDLMAPVGVGGMARVWMAKRHVAKGVVKSVAVKVLHEGSAADEHRQKKFLEEARLSMLLSHSNIVQVFDAGVSKERLYLVMEWVDGCSLAQLLERLRSDGRRLDVALAIYITGELLAALEYAHGLDHEGRETTVIHRDISPHNVLISVSGEVKLADFGVARLSEEETSGICVKGKLRFMPPEQVSGDSRSPAVDLFAIGAILHEMLSGSRFRGDHELPARGSPTPPGVPALSREDAELAPKSLVELRRDLLATKPIVRGSASLALRRLEQCAGAGSLLASRRALAELCRELEGVAGPRTSLPWAPAATLSLLAPLAELSDPPPGTETRTRLHTSQPTPRGAWRSGLVLLVASTAAVCVLVLVALEFTRPSAGPETATRTTSAEASAPGRASVAESSTAESTELAEAAPELIANAPSDAPDEPRPADDGGAEASESPERAAAEPVEALEVGEDAAPRVDVVARPHRGGARASKRRPALRSCGDGLCELAIAENCRSCPEDCGCLPGESCRERRGGAEIACVPNTIRIK